MTLKKIGNCSRKKIFDKDNIGIWRSKSIFQSEENPNLKFPLLFITYTARGKARQFQNWNIFWIEWSRSYIVLAKHFKLNFLQKYFQYYFERQNQRYFWSNDFKKAKLVMLRSSKSSVQSAAAGHVGHVGQNSSATVARSVAAIWRLFLFK